ncbi:hypothetical protein BDY21DRAFT_155318 [Lineolata rhizophorae]|uniref:Uncharacterized protein n=1 Tax=Lineolata rhizophorae TaxID=578093 RepID=A0A6A6NM26_9PEZI|nr:hypothetical protein BDY21DRAFT_155318 [Lineolata rhizophorae]
MSSGEGAPTHDPDQQQSNRLAQGALVLAAGAFFVAALQAILEYASSSSTRDKCTEAAIGVSHRLVKYGWNMKGWRLKVQYPVLDLSQKKVMDSYRERRNNDIVEKFYPFLERRRARGLSCKFVFPKELDDLRWYHIWDPYSVLIVSGSSGGYKPIAWSDLTWAERKVFLRWKFWERNTHSRITRPRATWAQLLVCMGLLNTKTLCYRWEDAERIPSAVSAAVQRVKLFDLGTFALFSAFTTVRIDVRNREFYAESRFATIRTEEMPQYGKIIRFDGDIWQIIAQVENANPTERISALYFAAGHLSFGAYECDVVCPLHLVLKAAKTGFDSDAFETELREARIATYGRSEDMSLCILGHEARLFTEMHGRSCNTMGGEDPSKILFSSMDVWSNKTKKRVPTIWAASMFTSLYGVCCGFPSRAFVEPFIPWIKTAARRINARKPPYIKESRSVWLALRDDRLDFARTNSYYILDAFGEGSSTDRIYGWNISPMQHVWAGLPEEVRAEVFGATSNREWAGCPNVIMYPESMYILRHFDLAKSAVKFAEEEVYNNPRFELVALIWTQIIIMDMAIQYMVRGELETVKSKSREWQQEDIGVVEAIVRMWSREPIDNVVERKLKSTSSQGSDIAPDTSKGPTAEEIELSDVRTATPSIAEGASSESDKLKQASTPEGSPEAIREKGVLDDGYPDLKYYLKKYSKLETRPGFGGDEEEQDKKFQQLADMLELRALFVIAYMMLGPDSSDVYLNQRSEIEMPML